MGSKKNVDMTVTTDTVKVVKAAEPSVAADTAVEATTETGANSQKAEKTSKKVAKPKKTRSRSKKYVAMRAQVDKTKTYDLFAAVEMLKRLSYSKFDGTVSASGVVKEEGVVGTVNFPHSTGKTKKVAIASDELLAEIEAGTIDFDVLLAKPEFMPKLAKLAPVLGPKGLMPNPKQGTLTEKPEEKKKELEAGKITLKTQRKMPVFHVAVGKTDMDTKQLVENVRTLVVACGKKLQRLSIAATMSPGIRVDLSSIETE